MHDIQGLLFWGASYWFVFAYILLFVLSPVLEKGIRELARSQFRNLLILFFSMDFLYGWITASAGCGFEGGHTCISFIGLYLLGRYLRIYPIDSKLSPEMLYPIIVLLNTILSVLLLYLGYSKLTSKLYSYCSPFIILEAVLLLQIFTKRSFESKLINTIAVSSFAVYLLHGSFFITQELWFDKVRLFYDNLGTFAFAGAVLCYAVIWFTAAVLLDRIRIFLWNHLESRLIQHSFYA